MCSIDVTSSYMCSINRCDLLLYVLYRCDLLLYVLYRCDLILYVLYRCDLLLYENTVPICALYERHPYTSAIGATTYSMVAIASPFLYTSYSCNISMSRLYMLIVLPQSLHTIVSPQYVYTRHFISYRHAIGLQLAISLLQHEKLGGKPPILGKEPPLSRGEVSKEV